MAQSDLFRSLFRLYVNLWIERSYPTLQVEAEENHLKSAVAGNMQPNTSSTNFCVNEFKSLVRDFAASCFGLLLKVPRNPQWALVTSSTLDNGKSYCNGEILPAAPRVNG